jgi:glycosyltransferase involved in cell wall biosynthesis
MLLGEYSGLHNNLAAGLEALGHNVVLANNGDNFKNFKRNIDLKIKTKNRFFFQLIRIVKEIKFLNSFQNNEFDIIQIMNPDVFSRFHIINPFKKLQNKTGKTFLLGAGDDYFYWKAFRESKYRYSSHKGTLELDMKIEKSLFETERFKKINLFLADAVSGIISCSISYKIAYKNHKNFKTNIPFPIEKSTIMRTFKFGFPIKFLFGIQKGREGFKGVKYILEAIELIKLKYPNEIVFKIVEDIPYEEYSKLLDDTDCLIDQCNSYDPGMNALIAMSKGKTVLSGCEKEFLDEMGLDMEPLINIIPNPNQIASAIEKLILNPNLISEYSKAARTYVEHYHDASIVAQQYIKVWQES